MMVSNDDDTPDQQHGRLLWNGVRKGASQTRFKTLRLSMYVCMYKMVSFYSIVE